MLVRLFQKNKVKIINLFIIFGLFTVYQLVVNTSYILKPWEDELIALTSSVNFFNSLNFLPSNSYGNFSYALTSGIISSIGGVVGWELTESFASARVINFFYVFTVQFLMATYIFKSNKNFNLFYLLFFSAIQILLVPWWFSTMYLIGEIISTLVFVNALFIFKNNPKLSLFLMGVSVIFGKFLMIIPSVFFLASKFRINEVKKSIYASSYFFIPFISWYMLIYFKIGSNEFFEYLNNFFGTLANREDSGVQSVYKLSLNTIIENLQKSEVSQWTYASILRAAVAPILFLGIYFRNKERLFNELGVSFTSVFLGIVGTYGWFWALTPFKYIRQSTHFVLIVVFLSFYIILFTTSLDKLYKLLLLVNISLFLSDIKLVLVFNVVIFLYYFSLQNLKDIVSVEFVLIIFLVLNLVNMNLEVQEKDKFDYEFNSCVQNLFSEQCTDDYLSGSTN
ncbi:MAG: hypothetical protein CBE17_01865 [Gammaproteobacteria bacterium TMED257]|nr:MAG: hypothetical protein CBE17_01865 [Gammaproteobacteria bacterium TMED257]|tara:strand:+ start:1734 stop:3086 length:1353 start_codon:yes stop_codon:yes gene_type:complete